MIEEVPPPLPPSPPTSPEITEPIYNGKKTDEKSIGYLAIKERVKNSEKILKNIQTGKSYFNYIKSNKIEDELKFVSNNMCSNKVTIKPSTPKPLHERLKKKFHKIDSQYQMNIINMNMNENDNKNEENSSSIYSSSTSFMHLLNSPHSPIHTLNKLDYHNNNKSFKRKFNTEKNKNKKKNNKDKIPQLVYIMIYLFIYLLLL